MGRLVVNLAWLMMVLPGMWLSLPLLKAGFLKPVKREKRRLGEMLNFALATFLGTLITYSVIALSIAHLSKE